MLSSTRLRYLEYPQGVCLIFVILISGIFGCTSITAPKISPGSASGGSSGIVPLDGGTAGRDAGGGGASGDAAGLGGDGRIVTDGMRDATSAADGPSSGGSGRGGSGGGGGSPGGAGGIGGGGAGGMVPDAAVDAPALIPDGFVPAVQGATCSANSDCASTVCADGFCCDKACTGCNACDQTLTGQPSGTCALVTSGKNAHNFCKDETTTKKCGNDGTCDGAGACRNASTSVVCTDASCNGSVFTPVSTCDGKGACVTVKTQDCAPYLCASTGCQKTCAVPTDCDTTTYYCDTTNNVCASKKANGSTASSGSQCTSGVVADGVCCDKDCTGCSACTKLLNGQTDGQCLAVPAGNAGHSTCTAANTSCGTTGMCDGAGKCQYGAKGTKCGSTCTGATVTPKTCDGAGNCNAGTPTSCGLYTCASTGDICGTRKAPGIACSAAADCDSGVCADNLTGTSKICCSASCSTCKGCNANGIGCTSKNTGASDSACGAAGGASCENGQCDGAGACQKAANGASCGNNQYCHDQGTCGSCTPNQDCTPANSCKKWQTSCATGVSACQQTTTDVNNGTPCGVAKSCVVSTLTQAQTCTGGQCSALSQSTCPYGCAAAGNVCKDAVCGNGTVESPAEQCDPPSLSQTCGYGGMCPLCSPTCQSITVTGPYCGDGLINGPEVCDNGALNTNVCNRASSDTTCCGGNCKTCGNTAGPGSALQPNDSEGDFYATGLYFQATQNSTLVQFDYHNAGKPYSVELWKIASPIENSTRVQMVQGTPPVGGSDPTLIVNWSLDAGGTYLLLDEVAGNSTRGPYNFGTGLANGGGVLIKGSWQAESPGSVWYLGVYDQLNTVWYNFLNLNFCQR
jgi:hypothetical protein